MNIFEHLHDHFVPHARNNYRPHALAHRSLSLYAGLLISVKMVSLLSLDLLPQNQAFSSAVERVNIIELTNYSRSTYGLEFLKQSPVLDQAAQAKAENMLKEQYFAHNSPSGISPWDFINKAGYNYIIAGENLAINFYTAEGVEKAWMNSPGHKANILNKDFQDIGVGVAQGEYQGVKAIFVVQMFGTSIDQPIKSKLAFDTPQPLEKNTIEMPKSTTVALAKPEFSQTQFQLLNKKEVSLLAKAPGATSAYLLVNHEPVERILVPADGQFTIQTTLPEGQSTLNIIAFDDQARVSPISEDLRVHVDTTPAQIVDTKVQPFYDGQDEYYRIEVHVQGDPVKIVARLGNKAVLLQQSTDPNIWSGAIRATDLQGKLTLAAYDLAGNSSLAQAADFSKTILDSFGFLAQKQSDVRIGFMDFASNDVNAFYIYFILFMLVLMTAAILIKRHILHVPMVAHTAGVIGLALMLWVV